MDASQIFTVIIAIYGAALSTYLGINELRRRRPRLSVSADHGYLYDSAGNPSEPIISMEAVNHGSQTIYLNGVGFMNEDGTKQHLTRPYPQGILPTELDPGRKCTTAYACRWLREYAENWKISGIYFQDETGKRWVRELKRNVIERWLESHGDGWRLDNANQVGG